MKKIEILAPAGDMKCLRAAIQAGCDAIYLGGKSFGARAYSKNFSDDELIEAINYAHLYGVKIYVTCNTLIYDREVDEFLEYIEFLHKNNVDAVLIQDFGMLDLVRKTYPNLEVHSSTQMHIHNLDGAKLMEKLGVKRVVLARETSIEDIKNIKENTNVEIEIFVHGALCISYSGQCLMSFFNGGRSGNRGSCAQCCRNLYDVMDNNEILNKEEKYPLSTKDLNTLENIHKLIDIGVDSLKIEGRMKSPAYVYLVVSLYRQALDSYVKNKKVVINNDLLNKLKIIFNREYTKGFLFNEDNNKFINMKTSNHQGIKIGEVINYKNNIVSVKLCDSIYIGDALRIKSKNEDAIVLNNFYINKKLVKEAKKGDIITFQTHNKIDINSIVLKTASKRITEEIDEIINSNLRRVALTVTVTAKVGERLKIVATDGINSSKKESVVLEKSLNQPTTKDVLIEKINKLSDSVYKINSLKINIDDNVFVPMKLFNDLRREVINELNEKRLYKIKFIKNEYKIDVPDFKKEKNINILINSKKQYDSLNKKKYKYIYSNEAIDNTILRLPRVMYNYADIKGHVLVGEIGALNKLKDVDSDFSFNVLNSYTVAFLHNLGVKKITLSYELTYEQIKELVKEYENRHHKHPNLEVIILSNPEVMISKFRLNKYFNTNNTLLLKGNNNTYLVRDNDNYMSIYLKDKIIRKEDYFAIGINNIREDIEVLYE